MDGYIDWRVCHTKDPCTNMLHWWQNIHAPRSSSVINDLELLWLNCTDGHTIYINGKRWEAPLKPRAKPPVAP